MISANYILDILSNVLSGSRISTKIGPGLKVSARDAFIFSSITGSAYLENFLFPFTPKGLLKIFYNANQFNFVTGIFDNSYLRNTPYYLSKQREYLNNGDKIIVPIEISSEKYLQLLLEETFGNNFDNNLLILKIDTSKNGGGLEPFLEYLTCMYFNSRGYITENQIPLSHTLGSPDFGGFGVDNFIDTHNDFFELSSGFNVIELAMIRSFEKKSNKKNNSENDLIVGEAKTSTSVMKKQLEKYLSSFFFDYGFEIHFNKKKLESDLGLFTLNDSSPIFFKPENNNRSKTKEKKSYIDWLNIYFRLYIISNYDNDELNSLSLRYQNKNIDSKDDLVSFAKLFPINKHLKLLNEVIKNGSIK